jgi:hypothetical protein
LSTVPDGSTIQFQTDGCYEVNETLLFVNMANIIVNGNGATFDNTLTDTNATIWDAQGGSNITFENMTIEGSQESVWGTGATWLTNCSTGSPYEWQYGITFDGTQGGLVDNVTINDVSGDFIEAEDDNGNSHSAPAANILIENSTFSYAGRMGIGVTDGDGVTVQNSSFSNVCGWMVDMETDTSYEYSANVNILNNTLDGGDFGMLSDGGNAAPANSGPVTVTGNTMLAAPNTDVDPITVNPITGTVSTGFVIDNNYIITLNAGIAVNSENNGVINNNQVGLATYQGGSPTPVDIASDNSVQIENNTGFCYLDNWGWGAVYTDSSTNITQSGNTISSAACVE